MSSQESEDCLKEAAVTGNVAFLKNSVQYKKPNTYYLTAFPKCPPNEIRYGNIFHLAAFENREEFIKVAIELLPPDVVQDLILKQRDEDRYNPLHVAANIGNLKIVKLFLNVFRPLILSPSLKERPWLQTTTSEENTPCHVALLAGKEDCALEILRMDHKSLCNKLNIRKSSILYEAVTRGFRKFALEILTSQHTFNCSGFDGLTTLHCVAYCSEGEDICRILLQKEPELIEQKSYRGWSILHSWADSGKFWPYDCLLQSKDSISSVRTDFASLISHVDEFGSNPLHILAAHDTSSEDEVVKIAELVIKTYKNEADSKAKESKTILDNQPFPWLAHNNDGATPLELAINHGKQKLAKYILSLDNRALLECHQNALLFAIDKGCDEVADTILEIVDKQGWTQILNNDKQMNVLHLAPKCKNLCKQLLKRHPNLLEGLDKDGRTVLQSWVKLSEVWPFQYILKNTTGEVDSKTRRQFVQQLIYATDYDLNTAFHVAAISTTTASQEAMETIVKLLIEAYKDYTTTWRKFPPEWLPWLRRNKAGEGPLHLAIRNQCEKLALTFISPDNYQAGPIENVLDFYNPAHKSLFLAIENKCYQVARDILNRLDKKTRGDKYLVDSADKRSVLHLAPECSDAATDKEFWIWLVKELPDLVTEPDKSKNTPLDKAADCGSEWIIQTMLNTTTSAFEKQPFSWIKACEKGHVSVIRAFVEHNPEGFKDLCIKYKDTPMHHIRHDLALTNYEELLNLPRMKDLINIQDLNKATPLHIAIKNQDKCLAETLLNMDKLMYNIKDNEKKTAIDLLAKEYDDKSDWEEMCQRIGFDPSIKTTYFQRKTNLLDVRTSLFVVAALLATITFTAGFTLPGGFNQETGEAILAKKTAFLVFLISDTLAMCCSMLVLICLTWSMVYDSSKSLQLIDRSIVLLMLAFYSTLLAFMNGVYIVISPMSLWAAIVIIAMCSLIGVSAYPTLLYKVLYIRSKNKNQNQVDQMERLEQCTSVV